MTSGHHFVTVLAARPCLRDVIPSDSKLMGRRKTCNRLGPLHKVSKINFFPKRLCTSLSSMLSFQSLEHVWLKIWLKSNHNLERKLKILRKLRLFGQNLLATLPEIRVIDQISSALNFKNGHPRLQRIVWDKIKKFRYRAY